MNEFNMFSVIALVVTVMLAALVLF